MNRYFAKKVALSFGRAFAGVFVAGIVTVWLPVSTGHLNEGKVALLALGAAAVTAGLRAAQALFTELETDSLN